VLDELGGERIRFPMPALETVRVRKSLDVGSEEE
jgi:hypothetical protein